MKAYVYRRYGGPEVLELVDVPKPAPKDNEVLIKIHATTVTSADWRVRSLEMPRGFGPMARLALGITGPRQPILGTELAGVVEAVGKEVTKFQPGDEVFGFPGAEMGCHAEFRVLAEDGPVALKPSKLSFEEAASLCFGGTTALHFLRKAEIKAGDRILVIGASGGVGTALVQLAKQAGAEVTGVTSSANLDLVTSLGADRVIDYAREDFTRRNETYDVIADTVAATSFARCKHMLREKGRLLAIAGGMPDLLASLWAPLTGSRKVIFGPAQERPDDVQRLADLAETGVLRPVIDRRHTFAEMAEAHAYVDTGRKKGSVVVTVGT
ncbi:MAG: NAD(P)-dependent alcohol dehydrogenase [Alphaproteobacteria bacterium]|nr:NAD(P)-dependent alcohol dehydrogenase [Alphaproteobacteria bacterium]